VSLANYDDVLRVQVEPLWKLLFKLLSFCEFGRVDDITERASYELQPGLFVFLPLSINQSIMIFRVA